jgi:hypothetical protein
MLCLLVITLGVWVGVAPTQALVKSGSKEIREEDDEHPLSLAEDEVERLQALLLKRGIHTNSDDGADPGIELVANLSPLKPTSRIDSGGKCSVRYRGIIVSSSEDLPSYAEANAVDFEVGAGELVASLRLEMGIGWIGQRRFLLEIWHHNSGPLKVTGEGEVLVDTDLEEESLLTDPFVVRGTPDGDGATYTVELRAGAAAVTGTLSKLRLYRLD